MVFSARSNVGRFLIAVPIVMLVVYLVFLLPDEDTASLMADVLTPLFASAAAVTAFILYWITRKTPSQDMSLGLVVVFILLALGETAWAYYVEIVGEVPDVSVADFFWLSGYVVLTVLLFRISQITKAVRSKSVIVIEVIFWAALSPILFYVLKSSIESTDMALSEIIVWNMYTLLDGIILTFLILLIWSFRKGLLEDCWTFVAVSIAFMTIGDLLFTAYDAAGTYRVGGLSDVFYIGSYIMLTLGFVELLVTRTMSPPVENKRVSFDEVDEARLLMPQATYVVLGTDSRRAYDLLVRGLTAGLEGLIVADKVGSSIRPTFGLKHTEIYTLASSPGERVINPSNTTVLVDTITRFMEKGPKTIVILDGFDTISAYNDFRKALATVESLKEAVLATRSRLILPINRHMLSDVQLALIEKYSVIIQ
jgi:hypothetical protein